MSSKTIPIALVVAFSFSAAGQYSPRKHRGEIILTNHRVLKGWISLHSTDRFQTVRKIRFYADSLKDTYLEYGPREVPNFEINGQQGYMAMAVLNHCAHLDSPFTGCRDTVFKDFYMKVVVDGPFKLLSHGHIDHVDYYLHYTDMDTLYLEQLFLPRASKNADRASLRYMLLQQLEYFSELVNLTPTWAKYISYRIFHVASADIASVVHDFNLATKQSFQDRQLATDDKDSSSISIVVGGSIGLGKLHFPLGRPTLKGPVSSVLLGAEYVGKIDEGVEVRARAHLCLTHHLYPDFDFISVDPGASINASWAHRKKLYMFLGTGIRAYRNRWSTGTFKKIVAMGLEGDLRRNWFSLTWKAGVIIKKVGIEVGVEGVIVSEMCRYGFYNTPGGISLAVAKHFEFSLRRRNHPKIGPLEN